MLRLDVVSMVAEAVKTKASEMLSKTEGQSLQTGS